MAERITFHGHVPGAKRRFLDASFSLLASEAEGQGLVILESMSAGCVPIAYDIRYGPSDIITHGVNGFLVENGNVQALAETISKVVRMSDEDLSAMRQAAIDRAADFSARKIVSRWGTVLSEVSFADVSPVSAGRAELMDAAVAPSAIEVTVDVDSPLISSLSEAYLVWRSRKGSYFGRMRGSVDGSCFSAKVPLDRFSEIPKGLIDVSVDIVSGRDFRRIRIAGDGSNIKNGVEGINGSSRTRV